MKAILWLTLVCLAGVVAFRCVDDSSETPHVGTLPPYERSVSDVGEPASVELGSGGRIAPVQVNPFASSHTKIQVVDAANDVGVSGAFVTVYADGEALTQSTTDESGFAAVPVVATEGSRAWITAKHSDYVAAVKELVPELELHRIEMTRGTVIVGRVLNRANEVPTGAQIHLAGSIIIEASAPAPQVRHVQSVVPDSEGYYRFEGVPRGESVSVWATAPGHVSDPISPASAITSDSLDPISFWLDPLLYIDLTMVDDEIGSEVSISNSSEIDFKIANGHPPELLYYPPVGFPPELRSRLSTGQLKLFRSRNKLPGGTIGCTITVMAPGYSFVRETLSVEPFPTDPSLLRKSMVRLHPAPGTRQCRIHVPNRIDCAMPLTVIRAGQMLATFNGVLGVADHVITRLPVGALEARTGRFASSKQQSIQIEAGVGEQLVPIEMPENIAGLAIRPVDSNDKELQVFHILRFRSPATNGVFFSMATVLDGHAFTTGGIPAGQYQFTIESPGYRSVEVTADLTAGETKTVRPVLSPKR